MPHPADDMVVYVPAHKEAVDRVVPGAATEVVTGDSVPDFSDMFRPAVECNGYTFCSPASL